MFGRLRSTSDSPSTAMTSMTSYSKKEEASRKVSTNSNTSSSHSSSSSKHHHHHHHHQQQQQQAMDDLLTCPVCLEEYQVDSSGTREPLFLQCHHSICRVCLPKLVKSYSGQQNRFSSHGRDSAELPCPECRMVTVVPPGGLTQNFYLVSLIETRRKKNKEQESRLRMWCRECDCVALEYCSNHQVVHLTTILASTIESYYNNRKHLATVLQNRAEKKGKEAQEIQEAVDQLDRAAAALRRRLVSRLDQATLSQATANSLLQEIDKMNRRVRSHGKLIEPLSTKASMDTAGGPGGDCEGGGGGGGGGGGTEGVAERKISPSGKGDSPDVASALLHSNLRETRSDLRDVNIEDFSLISLDGQTSPSRQAPPVPPRAFDAANHQPSSSSTSSPTSSTSSSTRTSPILTRQTSYDHLSCREQESKILLLKECLNSLDKMTLKQEETTRGERSGKGKASVESLSKEALMEMFRRAIEVLEEGK